MNNITVIESKDNNKVKLLTSLKTKKGRQKSGLMLVEGLRAVKQLLDNNFELELIAFDKSALIESVEYNSILKLNIEKSIIIKKEIFENISDTVNSQGIIAVGKIPSYSVEKFFESKPKRVLLLDKIQDPGNAGTIIRTADSAGFSGILYLKGTVDLFSPKVCRSAMGSNIYVPILEISIDELIYQKDKGYKIYSTALDEGAKHYNKIVYGENSIIALGNEANGIEKPILEISDEKIYIPIYGRAESLNVAIAGAIVMYESLA